MRFKICWGIKGSCFEEEERNFKNEDAAWDYARDQALELVGYSAERIDPLTEDEVKRSEMKVVELLSTIPSDRRVEFVNYLLEKAEGV